MANKYIFDKNYFSVIIPFTNDCKVIERSLQSLLLQKMIGFEAIFINLGSNDGTEEIIAKYAKLNPNIEIINNSSITNINQAYNFGISISKGKYIKFMSAGSILDSKALLVLSKMMDTEKTNLAFHIKSQEFNNEQYVVPQSFNWVKKCVSPTYSFSVLDKIISINDLQHFIAFSKEKFVKENAFFDDTLSLFDCSKLIKLFCIDQKVSVIYYDMIREFFSDILTVVDTQKSLLDIISIKENITKYVEESYFVGAYKNQIDAFYINQLSKIYKFSSKNDAKKVVSKAKSNLKNFCFDYEATKEICNYKNLLFPKSNIKLSIIYTFSTVTENLKKYVDEFVKRSNLYEELLLVCTNAKCKDFNKQYQNCNQIKYIQTNDIYKVIKECVSGEYFIFQNDDSIIVDDLFDAVLYAFKTKASITFARLKKYEYDGEPVYSDYFKRATELFGYDNIYVNRLMDLLYKDAEIIYNTAYMIGLFEDAKYINLKYLSFISVLNCEKMAMYPQYVSAYKNNADFDYEEIAKIYSDITSLNFQKLCEQDKILYKMEVPDIESFYKKLYYYDLYHKKKLDALHININSKEQYQLNRMNVLNSGLWDERYYLKQFDFAKSKININPLDHYLVEGWKKGYSPSKYFDGPRYAKQHSIDKENPLVYYLNNGRFRYKTYPVNSYDTSENDVAEYWKKKKKNKKVIYMCITGNYDHLEEIKAHTYTNKEWDYVCFTDNKEYLKKKRFGIWQIRPIQYNKLDNTRNNRWHKVNPHILFPEYEESIYLDSNINILTPFLFDEIRERNTDLLLPKHAGNFSIYYEYIWALKSGVDRLDLIMAECEEILKQGFPFYYGMTECNIIYRRHNSKLVRDMMGDWWYWIKTYAKRDQLSFSYLLWKYHIKVKDCTFVNARIDYKDFLVFLHPAERK